MRWIVTVLLSAICGAVLAWMSGCTPTQSQLSTAASHTVTAVRIAACVESVLAEEDRARELAHRLAETAAELEADRLKAEAEEKAERDVTKLEPDPYRAPSTVAQEVDKIVRDAGAKQ